MILEALTPWQSFWAGTSVGDVVTWVLGGVAVLAFAWKGWPVLRKFVRTIDVVIQLADTLPKMQTDMAKVLHEVLPNGGSSLKDQATRTEAAVADLTKEVAHVRRQGASTKTTLARTERTLTDHIATTKE